MAPARFEIAEQEVETTKQTYRLIFEHFATQNKALPIEVENMLRLFVYYLPGDLVLDVGCGAGRESTYLLNQNLNLDGIDNVPEMISQAKKNCPTGHFEVADMRELPYPPSSFDGIWCSASFLHVPKIFGSKTIKGFRRVLKKGGLLYLSVMDGDFDALRPNKEMGWPDRHFSDYKEPEISALIVQAGFEVTHIYKNKTHWGVTFLHLLSKKH